MAERSPRTALIVIDMLPDFFDAAIWPDSELPGMRKELCRQVNAHVQLFRQAGQPVFWVRQAFEPDLSDAFPHMRRTGKAYTIRDTPGSEVLPELDRQPSDPLVTKKRFSAFFGTDLKDRLDTCGVGTVALCGVTTSWCIRSTATDAYQHGLDVLLCAEAMAGFSRRDHERDLQAMDGYIGTVVDIDELRQRLMK